MPSGGVVIRQVVQTGVAELVADPEVEGAWTLYINGVAQSHVDLGDPALIVFDYVRRMADIIETVAPAGPLEVLHLGAGAMTLPRHLAALRPASLQRVVEVDAVLLDLIGRKLPLEAQARIEAVVADGVEDVELSAPSRYDVIVADIFLGGRIPDHVCTTRFTRAAARALRPHGCFVANIMDGPPLAFAKAQIRRVRAAFDQVAVVADASVLRSRRHGNILLVGAGSEVDLTPLVRRLASDPFATRVELGDRLDRFLTR